MALREREVLVDERPDTVVLPDARPEARREEALTPSARAPWYRRREAPWMAGAAVAVVALLLFFALRPDDTAADLTPPVATDPLGPSNVDVDVVDTSARPWAWLSLPVPDDVRSRTINVSGSQDLFSLAGAGLGTIEPFMGSPVVADGPNVDQIFGQQAFSVSTPLGTGPPIVVFVPYAPDASILQVGQKVTFEGTLMPVPADFADMAGPEAAAIAAQTGVYVSAVPLTLTFVVTA